MQLKAGLSSQVQKTFFYIETFPCATLSSLSEEKKPMGSPLYFWILNDPTQIFDNFQCQS